MVSTKSKVITTKKSQSNTAGKLRKNDFPRFGAAISIARVDVLLKQAATHCSTIVAQRSALTKDITSKKLGELLAVYEQLSTVMGIAGELAHALFSVDTGNDAVREKQQQVQREATRIGTEVMWFSLTLKTWEPALLSHHAKALPRYAAWLDEIAIHAPYTKSEAEEKIIAFKDQSGSSTIDRLYTLITSDFVYELRFKGKLLKLTRGELQSYYSHPDRAVRKAAMDALLVPFEKNKIILGEIYQSVATDYDTETVTIRGYKKPIDGRHLGNRISEKTFSALMRSYRKNIGVFRRYIAVKQKILKYKDFTRYDFMAPVPGMPQKISYSQAQERVLSAFADFAPWMAQDAKRLFAEERVDAGPRRGKRDGACCYPLAPKETPLVILNFAGKYDDMFTIAHELGHAVHDVEAHGLSSLTYHPPLVLAESASTFAETVLFHHTLKSLRGQSAVALLCARLDDCLATIPSQLRYTAFELEAHEHIAQGGSIRELDRVWIKLAKQDFPDIVFADSSVQWSAIPHFFHSPFYCYSYAFGLLLVHALWNRYEKEGAAFVPKFRAILAAGGSIPPEELLAQHGFAITTEAFWDEGFAAIGKLVDELAKKAAISI